MIRTGAVDSVAGVARMTVAAVACSRVVTERVTATAAVVVRTFVYVYARRHGRTQWRQRAGEGEASPLWVDVQKLCNMCVVSLSNPTNSLCTAVNVSASGGRRTLDPL